jgi:hypothetical protein
VNVAMAKEVHDLLFMQMRIFAPFMHGEAAPQWPTASRIAKKRRTLAACISTTDYRIDVLKASKETLVRSLKPHILRYCPGSIYWVPCGSKGESPKVEFYPLVW